MSKRQAKNIEIVGLIGRLLIISLILIGTYLETGIFTVIILFLIIVYIESIWFQVIKLIELVTGE